MGRSFSLWLPAKYSSNVKQPCPGVFAHVAPCPYSWGTQWSLAFLQGSIQSPVSMSTYSRKRWRATEMGYAVNMQLIVSEDGQKCSRGTWHVPWKDDESEHSVGMCLFQQIFWQNTGTFPNLPARQVSVKSLPCFMPARQPNSLAVCPAACWGEKMPGLQTSQY